MWPLHHLGTAKAQPPRKRAAAVERLFRLGGVPFPGEAERYFLGNSNRERSGSFTGDEDAAAAFGEGGFHQEVHGRGELGLHCRFVGDGDLDGARQKVHWCFLFRFVLPHDRRGRSCDGSGERTELSAWASAGGPLLVRKPTVCNRRRNTKSFPALRGTELSSDHYDRRVLPGAVRTREGPMRRTNRQMHCYRRFEQRDN